MGSDPIWGRTPFGGGAQEAEYDYLMGNKTFKLTVSLPREEIDFAKDYAQAHGISVAEMFGRYLRALRSNHTSLNVEVRSISGLIPNDIDGRQEYRDYQWGKHS